MLPIVDPSLTLNVVIVRPFCTISIVNRRRFSLDVDAVISPKSFAIVTFGIIGRELRPSDGKC